MTSPPGPGQQQGADGQSYPSSGPAPQPYGPPGPYGPPQQWGPPQQHGPGQHYGPPPQYGSPPQYGVPPSGGAPQYGPPPQYGSPPQYGPAPSGQAAQYGQAQYGQAPPPRKSSAGKIIAIVAGVVVVLLVLGGFAVYQLVSSAANRVGDLAGGVGTTCDAVASADVNAALGGNFDVIQLGGLSAIAAPVLDSRVLSDAQSCWAVETGSSDTGGRLARIARYSGPDAAQRFATERTTAGGTSQDQGNGLSVSSSAYLNTGKEVDAGDEAFCTTGDFSGSAGALVRRGDLLVYVSTTAAGDGAAAVPSIEFDPDAGADDAIHFATDDANCDLAVAVAAAVH